MKKYLRLIIFAFLAQSLISCTVLGPIVGFNFSHKTPKRAGIYPKFTEKDSLRGSIGKYRKNYDVTFYDLNIDVNPEKQYIKGFVDIYFTALSDLDKIQIDLYDNMKINNISFESGELKYTRKYNAVFVSFDNKIAQGNKAKIRVFYEGVPIIAKNPPWECGFVWKKDDNNNPWIGVACEVYGASLWWPLKDVLYDEPDSMALSITIPEGLFCVSNGLLIKHEKTGNQEMFTWKTRYPINTYDATIYIGDFRHFSIPYVNDKESFKLDFYVLPYHYELAKEHFKQAVDIVKFYESVYGEYPWAKEDYKLVEAPYEGMENQTAIAYGNGYKNGPLIPNVDYIILHESAHEWWGNSVTAKDYAECWLHEGFATYSEALYDEHINGYYAYLNYLTIYSWMIKNKNPVIGPYDVNYWNEKDTDPYMKGALTLHTLRNLINNDSLFFKIIKTFYQKKKYSIAETKDLINVVNNMTGNDYTWFFKQYLYDRVCPQLEWNVRYNKKVQAYELLYKWDNVGDEFKLPVTVHADGKDVLIYPSVQLQAMKLKSSITPAPLKPYSFTPYVKDNEYFYLNTNCSYIALKQNHHLKI